MVNPRRKPKFVWWMSQSYKRLKPAWRRQHGAHGKVRQKKKGKQPIPSVSYGAPRKLRYVHPSGFREILIHNAKDLERVDAAKDAAKIASAVGKKKRSDILKKAEELKIRILNP